MAGAETLAPTDGFVADPVVLRDFYDPTDFSDAEVAQELERVHEETALEREWFAQAPYKPFRTAFDLEVAQRAGRLEHVEEMPGVRPIWPLLTRDPSYSPPLLRPVAAHALEYIGATWAEQAGDGEDMIWSLSVTSMTRWTAYQAKIANGPRKIAIKPTKNEHSSHEYGFAFDLDAGGLHYHDGEKWDAAHPRVEHDFHNKIHAGRTALRGILIDLADQEVINYCEELPGTQQWCFHICVNPTMSASQILFGLRIPRLEQ